MKNLVLVLLLSLISCKSYIDTKKSKDTYKELEFTYNNNYNTLTISSRLPAIADHQILNSQKFSINIPINIVNWSIINTKYIIEYDDKQIIVIDAGYVEDVTNASNWNLIDTEDDTVYSTLYTYFEDNNYSYDTLESTKKHRITKILTDGKVKIILFNIKEKKINNYVNLLKSISYF